MPKTRRTRKVGGKRRKSMKGGYDIQGAMKKGWRMTHFSIIPNLRKKNDAVKHAKHSR